jgi:hypothetical protein
MGGYHQHVKRELFGGEAYQAVTKGFAIGSIGVAP